MAGNLLATDKALVKTPHKSAFYDEHQLAEFIKCVDPVTGPAYFMSHYFYIQHPTKGKMLYQPYPYQVGLLASMHNYIYSVNLCSRQMGKTTTAAGYLLWYGMFKQDQTILVAAHKYSGAQEIMARIRYAYETMPDFIRAGATSYNKGSIEFENGSRIISVATTENTGRGLSISLLFADEFSFVRPSIAREWWSAISPTLSTGGKAIITSTPNSDDDQFWSIWLEANRTTDEYGNETELGTNGFKAFKAIWSDHPDRDAEWAIAEKSRLTEERFRREHLCEPIIYEETLISALHLADMLSTEPIEKQGQVRWYHKPSRDKMYVVALDPSLGTGGDHAAIEIYELPTFRQVGEWQHNKTSIQQQVRLLSEIVKHIYETVKTENNIYYSVENNTLGEAALVAINEYGEENIRGSFLHETKKAGKTRVHRQGFTTTHQSKLSVCAKFKQLIETKRLKLSSKQLISELKTFVASGVSFNARVGEHDDLVSATLLAVRMMQSLQSYDAQMDSHMRGLEEPLVLPMPFIVC